MGGSKAKFNKLELVDFVGESEDKVLEDAQSLRSGLWCFEEGFKCGGKLVP